MDDDIGKIAFELYKDGRGYDSSYYHTRNRDYYEYRHNGGSENLWHKLADGSYVSVSVTYEDKEVCTPINSSRSNSYYYNNKDNLRVLINGEYQNVSVSRSWSAGEYTYTYTLNNNQIESSRGRNSIPTFDGIEGGLYLLTGTVRTYTYTYTDSNNVVQTIGTSTGADTVFSPTLYRRTTVDSGTKRIDAIKSAATNFINAVAEKAAGADKDIATTDDNINHRIAVVGFASRSGYGNNTELLSISGWNSGSVGVAYNDISSPQDYKDVVQNMDTSAGQTMVTNAINALAASGATRIDLGMQMAENILNANPVPTDEQRNRVVIVFTDGAPTSFDGFNKTVANNAISSSSNIKEMGATVYSIGVFSGADAHSAGAEPDGNLPEGDGQMTAACNWFMQQVSSNNGTPKSPSYYLSASDAASLNNIFQQISDQIESGGTSSTLTEESVVKDIISPQFTLPAGATVDNITLETYACTGKDANGNYTWKNNNNTMGATAKISGDNVSVTGFNFSENYVGTVTENNKVSYRGHKLVISFQVEPKAGFLGGNDVPTNTSAGIYEKDSAEKPLLTFDRPAVNVPIKDVTVTAEDKNVYLKGELTAEQIKSGADVKVGDVKLDLSKPNYGLESWQTDYVNITVDIKDKDGNAIPADGLKDLTEDTTYTVTVTVKPKTVEPTSTEGKKAEAQSGSDEGKINVFKPELTFKDSTAYYGDTAPTDFGGNLTNTEWKHGETKSTDSGVTMIGTAPKLDLTYTPEDGKIADGKINTKEDISVDVSVKIGNADVTNQTSFVHTKCAGDNTCTDPTDGKFWIHVKTCTLSITKRGGAVDESYVFDVLKDGVKYSEVTVWGNGTETLVELPVGDYTISEKTDWSWRYSANNGGSAELTAQNPTGEITCTNTKNNNQWLNGFSTVVRNIFGQSK